MTPRTGIATALLLAACAPALATDLSLFERAGFRGRQLLLRGDTPDFSTLGHTGAISSLVIRAGRWEVCTEPAFKGHCAIFPPGEYPVLNGRFNDRVSSARPVLQP